MPREKSPVFLKWAGGKGSLIKHYLRYFPAEGERYFEPFVGSAAVFFKVRERFKRIELSDSNAELINCYLMVRDQLEPLMKLLAMHQEAHKKEHYYVVREMDRGGNLTTLYSPLQRAARFIYLNKTCYNGLWRVNRHGFFNVPMGRYRNPPILRPEVLTLASQALQGVTIAQRDFLSIEPITAAGDVIYLDPPYDPLTKTSSFTAYSTAPFGDAEQTALADLYRRLDAHGCILLLSNSDTPFVRDLYSGYKIVPIKARRAINTRADRRGEIAELLIVNR
ncbi:MAG TPA: DNA adenine methylase [Aggregatilineales bacterium]|nr:DNA adenine methylase [Aggregatilineales bacterium]